jgi:DDE superfamily endonuclease/Helix-turn-helix of DDE superfamily endonuclease
MILRYSELRQKPAIFKALTGLTVALFDELVWDLAPAYAEATVARRTRPGRQRAVGAGHPYSLAARDEFLLTVLWLRHYWTQEALGYFFSVSDTTALRASGRVLPLLEAAGRDTMRTDPPSRRQRFGVAEALRVYEELADLDDEARVVDSFEQRVQRPTHQQEADRHYSGKKKAHTLKVQVVVELGTGNVREVAPSVPGPCADPTVLRDSGAADRLPAGGRMLGDKAYRYKKHAARDPAPPPQVAIPRRKPRAQPLPPEDLVFNRTFAAVRIIVEHTIRDLRIFQALTQQDRHRRQQHTARVCAVVGLRARRCRPGRRDRRQVA